MKKTILTTALLFIISCWAYSQHKISGIIKDVDGEVLIGANILEKGTSNGTITDFAGIYSLLVQDSLTSIILISFTGYHTSEIKVAGKQKVNVNLSYDYLLDEVVVSGLAVQKKRQHLGYAVSGIQGSAKGIRIRGATSISSHNSNHAYNTDNQSYSAISANKFKKVSTDPLSTFSIDVDKASYSNIRRFINDGQLPPADAVRIEEMINYFDYDYPSPNGSHPITIVNEVMLCPWNKENKIVHIGMKATDAQLDKLPSSNLVFLIDVSGSMRSENKLPLLQKSMRYLVNNLRSTDQVAIAVYAGIKLAYEIATEYEEQFDNSRVIIATDGDFNVGINSDGDLQRLIEEKRKTGVYLTCLGFGMGNYKDSKLETLANKGNGNYAYIDNIQEAQRVLGAEFAGTIFTIAKDVKIQIEFNPKHVKEYKLIGYENRLLNNEDFEDDEVDAGEIGLGHTVTALYEIVPRTEKLNKKELRYTKQSTKHFGKKSREIAFVKVRYKDIDAKESTEFNMAVHDNNDEASQNGSFSSAVALFGLLLRDNKEVKKSSYDDVLALANASSIDDSKGYKKEFLALVTSAKDLND